MNLTAEQMAFLAQTNSCSVVKKDTGGFGVKEVSMFSRLWQKILKLFNLNFEEFDGRQESFPCWATCRGMPINYTVKLSSGKTAKAICLGPHRRWQAAKAGEPFNAEEIVGWRPPSWRKLGK